MSLEKLFSLERSFRSSRVLFPLSSLRIGKVQQGKLRKLLDVIVNLSFPHVKQGSIVVQVLILLRNGTGTLKANTVLTIGFRVSLHSDDPV